MFHSAGWGGSKTAKAESGRPNGQYCESGQEILRPDGGFQGYGDSRPAQQRAENYQ